MKLLLFISLLMIGCYSKTDASSKSELSGKVIKIVDGDTYDILFDNKTTQRIRMEGIDAPERGMPFYKVSKDYLGELCFGQTVLINKTNTDRYGRIVAKTYLPNGKELGLLMIEAGYAWHFKKYSSNEQLANAETEARNKRMGLWIDDKPIAPWEYRRK
jgi:micrococcal nuclease